jgi:hypothetical protein
LDVAMRASGTVLLTLDGTSSRATIAEGSSDAADLGVKSSRKDNAASATFGNGGGTVGNVEAITGTGLFGEDSVGIFGNRKTLAGQKCLVGLEIDGFDETRIR